VNTPQTTDSRTAEYPDYPTHRAAVCPFDPSPLLRELQDQIPIRRVRIWDGSSPWLVTRLEDQRLLLADGRISSDPTRPGYPTATPGIAQVNRRPATASSDDRTQPDDEAAFFINMDDPEHARQRRMIAAAFTVRRMEAMRPAVQRVVDDLIDALLAGPKPVDLVQAFALPVPSLVICQLLGVPYSDHEFFQSRSHLLLPNRTAAPELAVTAMGELRDYLNRLISDKQTHPADDVLSALAERVATGDLTPQQAADTGLMLLFGGHETTANMIALGTLALLEHPDQLARVREHSDDAALIASTVEELLRYLGIPQLGLRRVALEDIEVGGMTIRAGDGIVLATDIANRDPGSFADADRLDVDRNPRQQITFGFGVHQCVGQPLARLELEVVYSTLYRRIHRLRLAAEIEQVPFKYDEIFYGVYELPVTW
jgi:cytochrome P450